MSNKADIPEKDERDAGLSDDGASCAAPSSSYGMEDDQLDSPLGIRQLLERLSESQSAALVYFDHRSEVIFNREAHITGDIVGRDQQKQGAIASVLSSSTAVAGYVPGKDREKASSVYSPPSGHDRARAALAEKHVLILLGLARRGKWTAALELLREVQPGRVIEIKPDAAVDDLLSVGFERGKAYVIDTLSSDTCQNLTVASLGRLSELLRKANSYLVITIDKSVSLSESVLGAYLANWDELPNPRRVLEAHIKWMLDEAHRTPALKLADSAQVLKLLEGQLVPGEVDCLADLLVRVSRGSFNLAEGLSQFETSALQSLKEWYRSHDSLDQHAFMISIAVLNGSAYEVIAGASKRLASLIRESLGGATLQADAPFLKPRSSRLEETCARIVDGYAKTEFGRCPVELVMLNNPAYQSCVLQHVWSELDWLRVPLALWLQNLDQFGGMDDRAKAAAAVGELCKLDFAGTVAGIIRPWANDPDPEVRAAAAFALSIPAWNAGRAPHVLKLLHHWSTLKNNWRLNWTAAAAYGGLAGQRFPNVALRELLAMASGGDSRIRSIAGSSLLRLLVLLEGEPGACLGLLVALADATAEDRPTKAARNALHLFLELLQAETSSADPAEKTWPMLLRASRREVACRDLVVSLWRRALNEKTTRRAALEILRTHVNRSEEVPELYKAVEAIIFDVARNGISRETRRLLYHLNSWARASSPALTAAGRLLLVLDCDSSNEGRSANGNN